MASMFPPTHAAVAGSAVDQSKQSICTLVGLIIISPSGAIESFS
jgi:hypothetical protein